MRARVISRRKGKRGRSPNALSSVALSGKGPRGKGATHGGWEMGDLTPAGAPTDWTGAVEQVSGGYLMLTL